MLGLGAAIKPSCVVRRSIPDEGLKENLTTPLVTFSGAFFVMNNEQNSRTDRHLPAEFEGGANAVRFHPSAAQVAAAGSKNKLSVLDLAQGAERFSVRTDGPGKDVLSLAWNYDGSLLAMTGKNGVVHVFDPRAGVADVLVRSYQLLFWKRDVSGGRAKRSSARPS